MPGNPFARVVRTYPFPGVAHGLRKGTAAMVVRLAYMVIRLAHLAGTRVRLAGNEKRPGFGVDRLDEHWWVGRLGIEDLYW